MCMDAHFKDNNGPDAIEVSPGCTAQLAYWKDGVTPLSGTYGGFQGLRKLKQGSLKIDKAMSVKLTCSGSYGSYQYPGTLKNSGDSGLYGWMYH